MRTFAAIFTLIAILALPASQAWAGFGELAVGEARAVEQESLLSKLSSLMDPNRLMTAAIANSSQSALSAGVFDLNTTKDTAPLIFNHGEPSKAPSRSNSAWRARVQGVSIEGESSSAPTSEYSRCSFKPNGGIDCDP